MEPLELDMIKKQVQGLSEVQKLALYESKKKNEWLGVLFSFFLPGLGQIVMGSAGTGVLMLLLYLVPIVSAPLLYFVGWNLAMVLIGVLIATVVWIWSMVDAYQRAKRYNDMLYSAIFGA